MATKDRPIVVVTGSPVRGIQLHGPFATMESAVQWADFEVDTDTWWLADLYGPDEEVVT